MNRSYTNHETHTTDADTISTAPLRPTLKTIVLICCARAMSAVNPTRLTVHNCIAVSNLLITLNKPVAPKLHQENERDYPHITHTTPQTALHRLWMPPENIHNHSPT